MKTLCLFIIFLSAIVTLILHELGHLFMAKLICLPIDRFQIGMGKPVFSHKGKDTTYSFSPILLGGFVEYEPENIRKLPYFRHMAFLVIGGLMNIAFAYVLAVTGLFISGKHDILSSVYEGWHYIDQMTIIIFDSIVRIFTEGIDLSGYNGVFGSLNDVGDSIAGSGLSVIRQISAALLISSYFSFAIGLGNLLPIPSLDGGQVLTETIARIGHKFGYDLRKGIQKVNNTVFLLIMILSVLMFLPDIF